MNEPSTPATAAAEEILRARAKALARPLDDGQASTTALELLEFRIGRARYAVETKNVCEVHPLRNLTPLPSTPPLVLGIVNVRGRIVPVFDLVKLFDLPEHGVTDLHKIVVVEGSGMELGLLTDAAVEVRLLPEESLQPPLPTSAGIRGDYLKGITADGLVVLDVERLLADPRIIVHDDVES